MFRVEESDAPSAPFPSSPATPYGPRDVTSAFRLYHREMEKYERIGLGERPGYRKHVMLPVS